MSNPTSLSIGRRTFTVTTVQKTFGSRTELAYELTGSRGAKYCTVRNVNHTDKMFLCTLRGFGVAAGYEGLWLTDRNGKLEVFSW